MTILQKQFAVLTAAVLLLNGSAASVPVPVQTARKASVSAFAEQLLSADYSLPEQPFSELCYDSETGQLLRDGAPAGGSFAGFSAETGELLVERSAVLTQAELESGEDASGTVTLAEAAARIGCISRTENGRTAVSSPFQSGRLIVRAEGDLDLHGGTETASGFDGLHVLHYPTAADAYRAYNAFCADESITLAEPDLIYRVCDTEGDSELSEELTEGEWGYEAVGCDEFMQRLDAEQNEPNPVCVAVLDTGITAEHSWFRGRIAPGGCSFVPEVTDNADDHRHGTFCAGIIAHCTRDNVKILPVKVLDSIGFGTSLQVYCGMLYAAEQGADVISMSLSGIGTSLLLTESAAVLREAGISCIAAAGNESWDTIYENPANIQSVIAVSSVSILNRKDPAMPPEFRYDISGFSNTGKDIEFSAPGDHITSAYYNSRDSLATDSGTSMAAPFVAACFADLLDYDPTLTEDQIREALWQNAVDLGSPDYDPNFGFGMVCMKDFVLAEHYCDKPDASVRSGHFTAVTPVELSCYTENAEIYYTTDGSVPSREHGIRYDGTPVQIDRTMTLKASACCGDYPGPSVSAVTVCDYCIDSPVPVVSVRPGAYDSAVSLELRTAVPADIYYTLDGTLPDPATAVLYDGETVTLNETTLLCAVSVIGQMQSEPLRAAYEIGGAHKERLLQFDGTVLAGCALNDSEIDIAALAGSRKVTAVAPGVFANRSDLTAVILPDTVTELGADAFRDCGSLRTVKAAGTVTLGGSVFAGCGALESVTLGAVTEIPAYAFSGCKALRKSGLTMNTIRTVGAYAFAGSGITEQFDLTALESLGRYAFAEMEQLDLILPERITKIPDGLCRNTVKLSVSAAGASEIGAYAFASETDGRKILRMDLPFDRITAIGNSAFAYADLNGVSGGQIIFSALTDLDKGAFRYAKCRGMAFPQLRTVLSDTFENIRTEVLRLDCAELVCVNAIRPYEPESCCLIFGSGTAELESNAIGDPILFAAVAAPAYSAAAKYCMKQNYPFRETPDLFLPEDCPRLFSGEQTRLTAIPLGTGLRVSWQSDAETPAAPEQETLFADLDPFAVQGDLSSRKAMLWQDGRLLKTREANADITAFVKYTEITATDEPALVIWSEMLPGEEPAQLAGQPFSTKFTFTAPHEGDYICYAANPAAELRVQPENTSAFWQSGSGTAPERLSHVHLNDGETVTMTLRDLGSRAANAVLVTELYPKLTLADAVIETDEALRDYQPDAAPPAVTVRNQGTVLTAGTDYVLRYRFADQPGITEIYAVGIGMYTGILSRSAWDAEPLSEGTPLHLTCDGHITRLFRMIPAQSGQYVVSLTPGEPDRLPESGTTETMDTDLLLWDKDLNRIEAENTLNLTEQYLCSFTAGEPVYLMLYINENSGRSYVLNAEPLGDRGFLGYAVFAEQDADFTGTETDCPPAVLCYPPDFDPAQADGGSSGTGVPAPFALTAGEDYEWFRADPLLPGDVRWMLTGTGGQAGCTILTQKLHYDFTQTDEIRADEPFESGGGAVIFRYQQQRDEPVPAVTAADGSAFEAAYYFDRDASGECRTRLSYRYAQKLRSYREVYIAVRPLDGRPHSYCLQGEKKKLLIADAEAEPVTAYYTGQPLRPSFRVIYEGRELTENVDYAVHCDSECRECGSYYPQLTGIGDFIGTLDAFFTVVMPEPEQLTPVPEGIMNAVLRTPGATEVYSWVPEGRSCCLKKDSMPDAAVRLLDSKGITVGRAAGIGRQSSVFPVNAGEQYYVTVSLAAPKETGTVRFEVCEGLTALASCKITGEKVLHWSDRIELPVIRVFDGDTELTENEDYTLYTGGMQMQLGYNVLMIRGNGSYTGEAEYGYYVAPPLDMIYRYDEEITMNLEQDVKLESGAPGSSHSLCFTAPEDGTYYLDMSNYDKYCCTLLRYAADKKTVSAGRLCFPLKKGETIRFLSMMNWPESDLDPKDNASVRMTRKMPVVSFEQNGYGFQTEANGTFAVISLPPDCCGYILPETVTDPETGITAQFYEIFGKLTWHDYDYFVGTVTIYGTPGGAVEAFCDENGYCFSDIDPDCSVRGDLTGDGLVNNDDSQTLSRWLAEGGGMMLPGQAAEAADLDGDGVITLSDLYEILRIAKG